MKVKMEKKFRNTTEYKSGPALYILLGLIPFIGWIIFLVIAIRRQQFRGVWLNRFFLGLIYTLVYLIINATGFGIVNLIILAVWLFVWSIFDIFILIDYAKNANYYSIKQRLEEGFEVVNLEDPQVKLAIERAQKVKIPFWQFTSY